MNDEGKLGFWRTSHGKIHVADNPRRAKCGRVLSVDMEYMGEVVSEDEVPYKWWPLCYTGACEKYWTKVVPVPYYTITKDIGD